jgi:threonine synthase
VSISNPLINLSHISNDSSYHEERTQFLGNKCGNKNNPSLQTLSNVIRRNSLLDHLGFVLRSHSLFYCSVPKVATRTLLTYITYLHVRDELITSLTNNSSLYVNINSEIVNTNYLNQMLSSSITVNINR